MAEMIPLFGGQCGKALRSRCAAYPVRKRIPGGQGSVISMIGLSSDEQRQASSISCRWRYGFADSKRKPGRGTRPLRRHPVLMDGAQKTIRPWQRDSNGLATRSTLGPGHSQARKYGGSGIVFATPGAPRVAAHQIPGQTGSPSSTAG